MPDYNDATHITGELRSMDEIAEAIRHKKYGVDVREAMAQGFEYMKSWWDLVNTLSNQVKTLQGRVNSLESDLINLRNQHQEDTRMLSGRIEDNTREIADNRIKIDDQNKRIMELEKAVFGFDTVEITSPTKPNNSDLPMIEINTDRKD